MILLVDLVDEHPGPLNYDLMRCGARLRDWPDGGVSWGDLLDIVENAQPDTAMFKTLNPKWQQTVDTEMLRSAEMSLRWLVWAKTADGSKGRNMPEPWRWPWEEPARTHDVMDWDEAAKRFGWEAEMARFF